MIAEFIATLAVDEAAQACLGNRALMQSAAERGLAVGADFRKDPGDLGNNWRFDVRARGAQRFAKAMEGRNQGEGKRPVGPANSGAGAAV